MSEIIHVQNLRKSFTKGDSQIEVLKGIDLSIPEKSSVLIAGASGAGKSTLLHILGLLEEPSSGEYTFFGQDMLSKEDKAQAEFRNQEMGFVFQFHNLISFMTALENVLLPLKIANKSEEFSRKIAKEMLATVGLEHRVSHRPSELSGGEMQRVAIARALVNQPKVLFADEPTGNLDSQTGEEVSDLLFSLQKSQGMTLVVVTHNEKLMGRFDKKLTMKDGILI